MHKPLIAYIALMLAPLCAWSQTFTTRMGDAQASFYLGSLTDQLTADAWVSPGSPNELFDGAVNAAIRDAVSPARWVEFEKFVGSLKGRHYGSAYLMRDTSETKRKPAIIYAVSNYSERAPEIVNEELFRTLSDRERKQLAEAREEIPKLSERLASERKRIQEEVYAAVPESERTEDVNKQMNGLVRARIAPLEQELRSKQTKLEDTIKELTEKNKKAFDAENVFNSIYQSLAEANKQGLKSLAVPTLGYDMAGSLSQKDSVNLALAAYHSYQADHPDSTVKDFRISVYGTDNARNRRFAQKVYGDAFSDRSYLAAAKDLLKSKPEARVHRASENDFQAPRATFMEKIGGAVSDCKRRLGF